jgi:hypothetical protein
MRFEHSFIPLACQHKANSVESYAVCACHVEIDAHDVTSQHMPRYTRKGNDKMDECRFDVLFIVPLNGSVTYYKNEVV